MMIGTSRLVTAALGNTSNHTAARPCRAPPDRGMMWRVLAEERRPSFVGLGTVVGVLAIVAMPLVLAGWWGVLGGRVWFGPFLVVGGVGVALFFVHGWRRAGVALVTVAVSWFGLVMWLFNHIEGID